MPKLTEKKINAIVQVLTVNKDSAALMEKRGVNTFDVVLMGEYAIRWIQSQEKKR